MRKHAALVALVLLSLLELSGCSAHDVGTPTPSAAPRPSQAAATRPRVAIKHRFHLGSPALAISGNAERIVFGSRQPGDLDYSSVMSLDLRTGARTRVAHSEFRRGLVNWAGASGDWTVFTDQSHTQGEGGTDVLWRVVAVNPSLHLRKVLLSNGNTPDPWVPWLGSQDDYVYWSSAEADGKRTAREWLFHDGWQEPRTLLRHAVLTPGSESVGAESLVYLGPSASPTHGRRLGGDCWRVPLGGGSPEALTRTGRATGCATDGTWVVWSTLISPDTTPLPEEGLLDDPYEEWAERIDEREPELLHRGYLASSWPLALAGFAVYQGMDSHPVIQDLTEPQSKIRLRTTASDLGAIVGNRLALPHPIGQKDDEYVDVVELSRTR